MNFFLKNNLKIWQTLFLVFFVVGNLSIVKASQNLTWQEALKLTKENNKELAMSLAQIKDKELLKAIAETNQGLEINASLGANLNGDFTDKLSSGVNASLSARKLLYDGSYTKYNIALADEDIKNQYYNYLIKDANLRLELRQAFLNLLLAQEMFELNKSIAKRRKQQLDLIKLRYLGGLEHKGSLLTSEANYLKAENDVIIAKQDLMIRQEALKNIIGLDINFYANEKLQYLPQNQAQDFLAIIEQSPILKEVLFRLATAEYGLKIAKTDYLPKIYASGSLSKGYSFLEADTTSNESWQLGISISYSLWDSGKKDLAVQRAELQKEQMQKEKQKAKESLIYTLKKAWLDFKSSMLELENSQKFLEAVEERAKIASMQYQSGLINFDNWIIIEDSLVNIQKSYLGAQINTLSAEARWINAIGGTINEI